MFRRQIELIGESAQNELKKKSVLIVGAGGLGNVVTTQLSCVGLKKIYVVDFDEVELHNLHRQFQFSMADIGKKKSAVLAQKLNRCGDKKIEFFVKKFGELSFEKKIDLVIDCTDNFEVRKKIDKFAKQKKIPWVYGAVEGWSGQVCLFKEKNLDIFNIHKGHKIEGVLPPMVGIVGSIEAMMAIKYLANLEVEFDKLLFIDFSKNLKIASFNL